MKYFQHFNTKCKGVCVSFFSFVLFYSNYAKLNKSEVTASSGMALSLSFKKRQVSETDSFNALLTSNKMKRF